MPPARWFSPILLLLAVLVGGQALAQVTTGNTFTIGGIEVDVTAADAIKAREQGIREAYGRAAKLLVERMVAPEDRAKAPPLSAAQLDGMVRGVEFGRERTTANRYIATLAVVFSADGVKAWLGPAGITVAETVARPALVVPLWKARAGIEQLDDRNAWRDAWSKLETAGSAVPISIVRGDQLDQDALAVEEAFVGDVSALSRLNERYRAPTIVVAIIEVDKQSGALTVSGIRYDTQTGARSEIARTTLSDAGQLGEAARRMHARLDEEWRSVAVVRRDSQDALDVFVPIRGLSDWAQVRQRLGGIPAIKSVTVQTLESDRADLRVEFFGTAEQLQRTLAQAGLQLEKDAGKWRLQVR